MARLLNWLRLVFGKKQVVLTNVRGLKKIMHNGQEVLQKTPQGVPHIPDVYLNALSQVADRFECKDVSGFADAAIWFFVMRERDADVFFRDYWMK